MTVKSSHHKMSVQIIKLLNTMTLIFTYLNKMLVLKTALLTGGASPEQGSPSL